MGWSAKKATVKSLITASAPIDLKNRKSPAVSRQGTSLQYHLKANNNSKLIRVCKRMFLNTVGMKEWTILHWVKSNFNTVALPPEKDGRKINSAMRRGIVKDFLDALAKMESHYCRKDTERVYLEPIWDSKMHVYREYIVYCNAQGKKPVNFSVFNDVLEEEKISMFSPRKDQCDKCLLMQINTLISQKNLTKST